MTFRNHISSSGNSFKFDFIINGFINEWKKDGNFLALEMQLKQKFINGTEHEASGQKKEEKDSTGKIKSSTVEFGSNAYVKLNDMSFFYINGSMDSSLKYAVTTDGPQAIVLYPKFGDWMEQDPTFGINNAAKNLLSVTIFVISMIVLLL